MDNLDFYSSSNFEKQSSVEESNAIDSDQNDDEILVVDQLNSSQSEYIEYDNNDQ